MRNNIIGRFRVVSIPNGSINTAAMILMYKLAFIVSIPNGSINTLYKAYRKKNRIFVSIPNGSINTRDAKSSSHLLVMFQFQMVQLTQPTHHFQPTSIQVSIPNGSINTISYDNMKTAPMSFQFQMVQLTPSSKAKKNSKERLVRHILSSCKDTKSCRYMII